MSESTVSVSRLQSLSSVARAAALGRAAGLTAGRDAVRRGVWTLATTSWHPSDDWFFRAARAARYQLPDEVATALSWFDGLRAGWNAAGRERKPRRSSLPTSAVWSAQS